MFEPELIGALTRFADSIFPAPGTPEADALTDFGSLGRANFPAPHPAFNTLTLHPRLLAALARLLGVEVRELRLTQSDLWPKYGRDVDQASAPSDNREQRIHVDYPNHSLVHPPPWSRPEAVELIVYLSDAREVGGRTAIVPREGPEDPAYRWPIVGSPGIGALPYINDRDSAERAVATIDPELARWREQLYARERYVDYRRGDLLLYRHDTWHRGTPIIPGARRLVHNITYRLAHAEWISTLHTGWAWSAYQADQSFERLLASCSVDQRTVLGFPAPSSAYWCEATLAAVEARYGCFGMDLEPYRAGLREGC